MIKNGTKVIYVVGNHDEALRQLIPITFGDEITIIDEYVHITADDKKLLILHGDCFDFVSKWLSRFGSRIYDWLIVVSNLLHHIRLMLGFKTHWSLAGALKKKTKRALNAIKNFEDIMIRYAKSKKCDGVICGHIHTANLNINLVENFVYGNCGDWIESLTAITEKSNGELHLIRWHIDD
jgi:UDP-2,3-diacylglucosamine pyrophosphatase LpxH